jgi:hypothetical protein
MGGAMAMEKKKSELELKLDEPVTRIMKSASFQENVSFDSEARARKAADWLKTLSKYKEGKISVEVKGKDLVLMPGMKDTGLDGLIAMPCTAQESKAFDDFVNSMKQKDATLGYYSINGIKENLLKANAEIAEAFKAKGYILTENKKMSGFYAVDEVPNASVFVAPVLEQKKVEEIPAVQPQAAVPKAADLKELDITTQEINKQLKAGNVKEITWKSVKEKYNAFVDKYLFGDMGANIDAASAALEPIKRVQKTLVEQQAKIQQKVEEAKESGRKEMQDKYAGEMEDLKRRQADLEALVAKLAKQPKSAVKKVERKAPAAPERRISFALEGTAPARVEKPTVSDEVVAKNAAAILGLKSFSNPILGVYSENSRSANGTLKSSDSSKLRSLLLADKSEKERANEVISFTLNVEQQSAIANKAKADIVDMRVKVIRNEQGQDVVTVTRASQY